MKPVFEKMHKIRLRPEDLAVMYRHAEQEYPNECCGVIVGLFDDGEKNEVIPCKNIQGELKEKDPELYQRDADTGYFMDPKNVREVFEKAARENKQVIGFYHSHPNHDAYWSDEDHRAAMWAGSQEPSFPEASNIVVSVYDGKVKGASLFIWDESTRSFLRSDLSG